ncbi:DUF559 domain-containing protein [Gordonia sp. FQ]|uniref:DUF559 domain-containing protein n=1 Tax=Gordonia sp. FQ TaxID=3446634 RepID=UPI003F8262AC
MDESADLASIFAAQDGLITTAQAKSCDLTASDVHGRRTRREWLPVAPGVWRLAAFPYTERAMVRAAALVHRGVLDRTTAAWWHGLLPDLPQPLTLSVRSAVPESRWTGCPIDIVRRTFCAEDLAVVDGVSVTGLALSILGAVASADDPSHFLDQLLQTSVVTLKDLEKALLRNPRMRGMSLARELVAVLDADTQSKAEEVFRRRVKAEGLDGCVQQYPFQGWAVDFAWPGLKVAVEIDGWAYHRDHKSFLRDMRKRNALARAGWVTLSFSWHDLTGDPAGCMELVIGLLRERMLLAG